MSIVSPVYTPTVLGAKVDFVRVRRVTGYLTGTTTRWNDAKRAELADRVKHSARTCGC